LQEQAYHFYRLLLRAESYRKALIWQKKYISLLLSSYQVFLQSPLPATES
jgi:hypothetical protein